MAESIPIAESVYFSGRKTFSSMMFKWRFLHIDGIIEKIIGRTGRCRILDIGGSEYYWQLNRPAIENVQSVHLLTIREMKLLFPDTEIRREYVGPFAKSIMAVREP